jgi:hypothetical protein
MFAPADVALPRVSVREVNWDADYLEGNTAAGELSRIFTIDVTAVEGQCAFCGVTKRFAEAHVYEAHVYMEGVGLVARCAACEHVPLRLVKAPDHVWLDMRGMTYFRFDAPEVEVPAAGTETVRAEH